MYHSPNCLAHLSHNYRVSISHACYELWHSGLFFPFSRLSFVSFVYAPWHFHICNTRIVIVIRNVIIVICLVIIFVVFPRMSIG